MTTQKFLLIALVLMPKAYALAPVESLVLGDFTSDYSENKTDPLNYVYSRDLMARNSKSEFKKELAVYRGFYEEGKNLNNYCKINHEIRYGSEWEKVQVKRSTMALIQYIGLDLAVRAIPQYAKNLEFTRDEYSNMVEGLVGNFCSTNISVISKRELLNNLYLKFDKENTFNTPTVTGNPFFPDNIDSYTPAKKAMEQELLYTVKLFQSLCSWNGNPSNPGLMAPILRHSGLMSFFARQMSSQSIGWKEVDNSLYLKEDLNTVQVWCENLICRKVSRETFNRRFSFSIGGTNVNEDIKRLYCEEFRDSDFKPKESDPRLAKIMNSMTFEEQNFVNSQFIALITGVPDFLLRAEKFNTGIDLLRSSIDFTWNKWATKATSDFTNDLYFEEPLMLELIENRLYYDFRSSKLKIAFDVNLGEFDRINQQAGKIKLGFKIYVQNSFLDYYRTALKETHFRDTKEKARLINRFKLQLTKDVLAAREKFIIPPWKGDLEGLIANEITSQILDTPEKFLNFKEEGMREISVEINYGVFALKYLNHQFETQRKEQKGLSKIRP